MNKQGQMTNETHLVLKGFDAIVYVSEEAGDNFEVVLSEGGNEVYQVTIPIPVDEDGELAYSEEYIDYAAQAAVDFYEAGRDTLGEGAGVTMKEAIKKQACVSIQWEDWYLKLRGTPYEEQAAIMLESYIDTSYDSINTEKELNDARVEESAAIYELDMLNFERLKEADPNQTVIVINASEKIACGLCSSPDIQEYLDKFKGSPLEIQAVDKMKELLDLRAIQNNLSNTIDEGWDEKKDLEAGMNELMIQCIQQNAVEALPDTGMESAPAMAADIAELMEGVDLNTPLEPMIARRAQEGVPEPKYSVGDEVIALAREGTFYEFDAEIIEEGQWNSERDQYVYLVKGDSKQLRVWEDKIEPRSGERTPDSKIGFEEDVDGVEDRIVELGEMHEGLDPAEIPISDFKFQIGDKVTTNKEFETVTFGGITYIISSGSKGVVNSLWDGHGDCLMVALDTGEVVKIPVSFLKKS